MEYIDVTGADLEPIKEPLKKSYIHAASNLALTANTLFDFMRDLKDSEQEAFVFMNPDATRKSSITFKRWVAQSENLAVSLVNLGVKPRDKVGVIVPNCEEIVITVGALLHCAAIPVFLTLDLKSGKDIEVKIKDTEINVIIVYMGDSEQKELVLKLFAKVLNGESDEKMPTLKHVVLIGDEIPEGSIYFPDLLKEKSDDEKLAILSCNDDVTMDDTFCINLTSGSTGKPKYCLLSHKNFIHSANTFQTRAALPKGCIEFNDRPMTWMGGVVSFAMALANKNTIVTIDAKQTVKTSGAETFLKIIQQEKVNQALVMPYLMYDIVNMDTIKRGSYDLSMLSMVATGGQRTDPVLIEKIKTLLDVGIIIGYGLTEGGFVCSMFPTADFTKQHLTVGYGMPHIEISIRNKENSILPINMQGEICIRGPNIFRGYLNDPVKTKELIDEKGWLHTGDIGTLTPYGYVTVVGRLKEFIKRGTVIIQPAKIENTLTEHPSIDQALVVGVPDPRLYEELCACIKVKDGQNLTTSDIEDWCKGIFGDFTADGLNSAPRYFLMLDEIPKLNNGKVDRESLKKMAAEKFGKYN